MQKPSVIVHRVGIFISLIFSCFSELWFLVWGATYSDFFPFSHVLGNQQYWNNLYNFLVKAFLFPYYIYWLQLDFNHWHLKVQSISVLLLEVPFISINKCLETIYSFKTGQCKFLLEHWSVNSRYFMAHKSCRLANCYQKKNSKKSTVSKCVKDFIKMEKGVRSKWSALQGKLPAADSKQGHCKCQFGIGLQVSFSGVHSGPTFFVFPAILCEPSCLTLLQYLG